MAEKQTGACGAEDGCSSLTRTEVFATLETGENGLSAEEAVARLEKYGPNEIREIHGRNQRAVGNLHVRRAGLLSGLLGGKRS